MISKFEILPNEILLHVFYYLSWDEMLVSLWSLNKRINSIICLIFSMNKNGIVLNNINLSYSKFYKILLPLILNSSTLSSNIKKICFNRITSISMNFIYEKIFNDDNNKEIKNPFHNLKSLSITECELSQLLIQILSYLIQYQLNELRLTFHEDIYTTFYCGQERSSCVSDIEQLENMFRQVLCQIFSDRCQLTSLQLDITKSFYSIHQCLKTNSHLSSNTISNESKSYCTTLRHLHIRLDSPSFLEDLIEYVPNLEQLSVDFEYLEPDNISYDSDVQSSTQPNENWFNKIPILKCFTLKSCIDNDAGLTYLKWLLNNLNHIIKLELHLYSDGIRRKDQTEWRFFVDANFIHQYCLSDKIINLKDFYFYIRTQCQLSLNDIEKIRNSFKTHSFFMSHQWTNVECFYDERQSYQHIFSSNLNKIQFCNILIKYPCVYNWSSIQDIKICLNSSLYLFLKQFNKLCPNVSSITIYPEPHSKRVGSLFNKKRRNLNKIHFRNVTKLRFGSRCSRDISPSRKPLAEDKAMAKIFSCIILMTVQLKYISIERLEWLLWIRRYAPNYLLQKTLLTVRYVELGIPSCHIGNNKSIHIGKSLSSLLYMYMPNLQTLCLWRPDDFPWISIRPDFTEASYGISVYRWKKSLLTFESINQHVTIFEQNLRELVKNLQQLVYLNIYGTIRHGKVEPYRLMVQTLFPNSRIDIQTTRFRLWM